MVLRILIRLLVASINAHTVVTLPFYIEPNQLLSLEKIIKNKQSSTQAASFYKQTLRTYIKPSIIQ